MILTKAQTFGIYINNSKIDSFQERYKFSTKTEWKCLSCLKTIFISYKQFGRNSIFCGPCYSLYAKSETIAQYMYMAKIKRTQMEMLESFLDETTI